jgi:hypothetical protein
MHVSHTVPSGSVIVVATDEKPCGRTAGAVRAEDVTDDAAADGAEVDGDDDPPPEPHAASPRASTPASSGR